MTTQISDLLMSAKPISTGATAVYPYSEVLARKFYGVSRFEEPLQLYTKSGNFIRLPRAVCPIGDKDTRVEGLSVDFDAINFIPRSEEQTKFVSECSNLLLKGHSFIARAYTGFGKTACAMPVIAAVGRVTMVVVPKEDLINRWREDLQKILGLKPEEIGFVRQDNFDIVGKKVIVGMLHSLVIDGRYPEWLFSHPGLVIFDEVHRLGAETFSRAAAKFSAKLRWGLSATVNRSDGKEVVFQAHIGATRVKTSEITLKPKVLRYVSSWRCPAFKDKYGLIRQIHHSPAKIGHILKYIVNDMGRNALCAALVESAYSKGRRTVFFSDRLDHLDTVKAILIKEGVPQSDIAHYVGGMSAKDRDVASGKPIILATYKMMAEGTNIPWLDTCVLGTPRAAVEQCIGRILREYPDKPQPVVFDIMDLGSPVFKRYCGSRMRWYQKVGAEVKDMPMQLSIDEEVADAG